MGWGRKEEKTYNLYKTRWIFWLYENSYVLTGIISIFSFRDNVMVEIEKIIKKIRNTIFYIGLSMFISSIFYYIALGVNKVAKYLSRLLGFKSKVITYPTKEKDEDILGIWES